MDSQLKPEELAGTARSTGLTACCVTEHDTVWDRHEAERFADQARMPLIRGMEVTTDLGHIIVFGLDRYLSGIRDPYVLRDRVQQAGGIMIAAHPFRNLLYHARSNGSQAPSNGRGIAREVELAAKAPIFRLVDEVEVLNGSTPDLENLLAAKVAQRLGFRGVASSDAHSINGIGRYVTVFERAVMTVEELVAEVKAGRFLPGERSMERPGQPVLPYLPDKDGEERLHAALGVRGQ